MEHMLAAAHRLPHRADFVGWVEVTGRGERRLSLAALRRLAHEHGLRPGRKRITEIMERRSRAFHSALLRGLFDTDGSVQGAQNKGVSIRLAQSELSTLAATQRMLARLGVASTIYRERRRASVALLPDGKGGQRHYPTRAQHELVVSEDNLAVFAERVGFSDHDKARRLSQALAGYRRAFNQEFFTAVVERIEEEGEAEVFDAAIPGLNAFDANGLWAHNCGEQPLPSYGACLLGSVNLTRLVIDPFTDRARIDTNGLAEVVKLGVPFM